VADVLERGHIYFFYRPRVHAEGAKSLDDVRRLYVVFSARRRRRVYRLVIIAEKRLPSVTGDGDRRSWGFVEKVAARPDEIEDELDPKAYETRTRGERVVPPARPAGEGVYAIARHEGHTHLAHLLELPRRTGDVQRALNIPDEGSYVLSVKNPEAASPPGAGLDESRRARYPKALFERFRGRRFIPVDPPELLDYEGAEILLIGAAKDVRSELGIELDPQHESDASAGIFRDLKIERSVHPVEPLVSGKWA
jgi:hypothetical protein